MLQGRRDGGCCSPRCSDRESFLDSTIVTVALPQIGEDLPSSLVGVLEGQSYVYYGYLLMAPACQDTRLQDDEIRGARQGSRWCHERLDRLREIDAPGLERSGRAWPYVTMAQARAQSC